MNLTPFEIEIMKRNADSLRDQVIATRELTKAISELVQVIKEMKK